MATNKFIRKAIAFCCGVCVNYLVLPLAMYLCEVEYELKYGESCYDIE